MGQRAEIFDFIMANHTFFERDKNNQQISLENGDL